MEVVGVVAAVPGLIEIIRALITTVRGLSSRKAGQRAAADLVVQLQDLHDILQDVQKNWRHHGATSSADRLQRLSPILTQLKTDLMSLETTLKASKFTKDPPRFLRRAYFLSTGLEKTLRESLTRLDHAKTSLTLIIAHHSDAVAQEILDISTSDIRLKLHALLHPSGHAFIPKRLDHTCEWIWSHSQFETWANMSGLASPLQSHTSRIFCLYGVKGCGKSVLAKSVAETLRGRGDIALHFSFWAGSETQRKLLDLLRTIVWQLLNRLPQDDFRRLSGHLVSEASINLRNAMETMRDVLNLLHTRVYCIIDGIDESADDWNDLGDEKPLPTILELVRSHPKLHLLLCGREPSMRTMLKESSPRLEVEETHIRDDMNRLIAAELNNALTIQTPEVKAMVQASLAEKSHVMFLWAMLILRELRRCFSLDEIKSTLSQVPRDLDREYHRLFARLMTRTRGTTTKPSPSTRRARRLLAAILASPEPMTAEELCYAYATLDDSSCKIEDNLIPVDGITDACGDFIRVTDGRYHLLHTSVADFLTRPIDEWAAEDSDIVYFCLTRGEAQQSMGSACLRYIESLDLEAPLAYGDFMKLPLRYPFFPYAIKCLPFFFSEVTHLGDAVWVQSHASRFIGTSQCCALLECAAMNIQQMLESDIDHLCYWMNLFDSSWWRDLDLMGAYHKELMRRLRAFGAHDDRYKSWLSFSLLIQAFGPPQSVDRKPQKVITEDSASGSATGKKSPAEIIKKGDKPRGIAAADDSAKAVLHALPQYLVRARGSGGVAMLSHNMNAVSQVVSGPLRWLPDLFALSVESLPGPLILLMATRANMRSDWPLARNLAEIATKKYKNTGGFLESNSLFLLASLTYRDDDEQETEDLLRKSLQIIDRLPPSSQTQLTRCMDLCILTCTLICQGRYDEASAEQRNLLHLVGSERQKSRNRLLEYFLCYTKLGTDLRISTLCYCAETYSDFELYEDAARLARDAVKIHENAKFSKIGLYERSLMVLKESLYGMGEHREYISVSQRFLDLQESNFRDGVNGGKTEEDMRNRWTTQLHMALCHASLGEMLDAIELYRRAADGFMELEHDAEDDAEADGIYLNELDWLVGDLALIGEYNRSVSVGVQILRARNIPYDPEATRCGFRVLDPLVERLRALGSVDDDYEEFLSCSVLLLTLARRASEPTSDWWLYYGDQIARHKVLSFHRRSVLGYLMYIDACLSACDGGVESAVLAYRALSRLLHFLGDDPAAALVASEGAARCFASPRPPQGLFGSGLLLASDDLQYRGQDTAQDVLLRSSYCAERRGCTGAREVFHVETRHARIITDQASSQAGDNHAVDRVQQARLERAGAHVVRAREANRILEAASDSCASTRALGEHRGSNQRGGTSEKGSRNGDGYGGDDDNDDDDDDDDDDDETYIEYRGEVLEDLEEDLMQLGAGQLLDAAMAEAETRRRGARRVKSFEGYALDKPTLVFHKVDSIRRVCSVEDLASQDCL